MKWREIVNMFYVSSSSNMVILLAWTLLCLWHYRAFSPHCPHFHFYNLYVIGLPGQLFSLTRLNQQTEICSPLRFIHIIFLIFLIACTCFFLLYRVIFLLPFLSVTSACLNNIPPELALDFNFYSNFSVTAKLRWCRGFSCAVPLPLSASPTRVVFLLQLVSLGSISFYN